MKKSTATVATDIQMCPKYKKRYQMEKICNVVGVDKNGFSYPDKVRCFCPACGDFHTFEL